MCCPGSASPNLFEFVVFKLAVPGWQMSFRMAKGLHVNVLSFTFRGQMMDLLSVGIGMQDCVSAANGVPIGKQQSRTPSQSVSSNGGSVEVLTEHVGRAFYGGMCGIWLLFHCSVPFI